jgi:hypothetical protein
MAVQSAVAKRKGPRELCSPLSSLDVTSTVQQRGRKKVAGPMKESAAVRLYELLSFFAMFRFIVFAMHLDIV